MSAINILLYFGILVWIFLIICKKFVDIILSRLLTKIIKNIFPKDDVLIRVDHFGYFCVHGVHISSSERHFLTIGKILLQFVWEESSLGLKLQSTISDIQFDLSPGVSKSCKESSKFVIKGSVTLGITLISLRKPYTLLNIAPETENLNQVWLYANNAEACVIQQQVNPGCSSDRLFYRLRISEGASLVLYNKEMARLVVLFNEAFLTCSPITNNQLETITVGSSDGLVLMYEFRNGDLVNSHCRLKHTELCITPSTLTTMEILLRRVTKQNDDENIDDTVSEEILCDDDSKKKNNQCETTFESENLTLDVVIPEIPTRFQLKFSVVSLSTPRTTMTKWNTSVPFELTYFDEITNVKDQVIGSKLDSTGLVNPCVLKAEGEDRRDMQWNISSNEGILIQIKPHYVSMLESFYKAYTTMLTTQLDDTVSAERGDNSNENNHVSASLDSIETTRSTPNHKVFQISANICEVLIDVFDSSDNKLLQITMSAPEFSMSQDTVKRSLMFTIANLAGSNCLSDVPFFYPTNESETSPSLSLSVTEEIVNDENKISYQNFSFGSCNTTVIIEETLIFAVLKYFRLDKKVAQIFFQREETMFVDKYSIFSRRFSFDYLELRAVEVILTLLPALELPIDLQVIKNDLGIPHQLPPRFENAVLNFGAFVRNDIQYSSYKYISNDIKRHYLKELGSQSASVLGSMHLLGNISRLKQDIITGFTTLRETGEFITFFRQVTSGVATSYSKFAGSWSDLFAMSYSSRSSPENDNLRERRHSVPSELNIASLQMIPETSLIDSTTPLKYSKDDTSSTDLNEDADAIWFKCSSSLDVNEDMHNLNWESSSSDGESGYALDFIPRNVKRQIKGQEFLRRLKENLGDNEHGEVFSCCIKVRKNDVTTKLNALMTNRKVYFLKGRPSHESLVLCVKYENLYKARYVFQERTHYLQLVKKIKGITALSIPTRNASENPLVRCDNMVISRKAATKLNELKQAYDHECMHSQHQ